MMNFSASAKSALLVSVMVVSSTISCFSISSITAYVPSKKALTAVFIFACWSRLQTKKTYGYKFDDWRADLKKLLESYDIFDIETYKTLVNLFDKWFIGRKLSIVDVEYETVKEDMIETISDKKLKTTPFGFMGLADAYVLGQLKKANEMIGEITKAQENYKKFSC